MMYRYSICSDLLSKVVIVASFAISAELARVSKASKLTILAYCEGVSLEARTKLTIEQLRHRAVVDRISLAESFVVAASKLAKARPVQHRSAISRYYYGMYHAARAIVYFAHNGDDHEAHAVLPTKFPSDFPRAAHWQNELKLARFQRNEADYEIYFLKPGPLSVATADLAFKVPQFIDVCRAYLRSKGCQYI
jgi:uncharacterized protein (UPF0332 family)